jgi:dTDP-4-dehydrorhamnose 3,5-epimerase
LKIEGVIRHELTVHADSRGDLAEFFRAEWASSVPLIQWTFVRSQANVMRGVHAHARHVDYLILLEGRMFVGLKDLRPTSPSYGRSAVFEWHEDQAVALQIPPGVAHGFYSIDRTVHVGGASHYWHPMDELGCRWDDPALGIGWPHLDPILSARDQNLDTMRALEAELLTRQSDLCALD